MKLFTKNDWLTHRIEEMTWGPYDEKTAENLGLWLGIIQSVVFRGVKEIPDKDNLVSSNQKWTLQKNMFDYVYRTMYISDEKLNNLK